MLTVLSEHMTVAACQDDGDIRKAPANSPAQLQPAHARHDHVGEDDVKATTIRLASSSARALLPSVAKDGVKAERL